jgi:RNA polymerase sigma-B factor
MHTDLRGVSAPLAPDAVEAGPHRTVSTTKATVIDQREGERSDREVNELISAYQEYGDRRSLETVMAAFDWLAVACARRMQRRGESIEDLEQVAREGLMGAIERFDPTRGVPFKSFAWATAVGVLRHHYRSRWQVRVPRGLQELHLAAMRAIEELTAVSNRAPTVDELASHMNVDREDVILALDVGHAYRVESVDYPSADRSGSGLQERVLTVSDKALEGLADRVDLRQLLIALPEVQRSILVMSFFEGKTQSEIGACLGVSQVHVSRLMRAALADLRECVRPD